MPTTKTEFQNLIKGLLISPKSTHDLTNILESTDLLDLKHFTISEGGCFINANDVVQFIFQNKSKKQPLFFIIVGYDISSNKTFIRFNKHF